MPRWLLLLSGVFALAVALIVGASMTRPAVEEFTPTRSTPQEVGDSLVANRIFTIDARHPDRWAFFDFSRGAVIEDPGPAEWDLAVRRFRLITNGGAELSGSAAALDAGEVSFDELVEAPADGYSTTAGSLDGEPGNPALADWYRYGFITHVLTPSPRTFVVRTADGRYAKFRVLSYYCAEAEPGCLTLEYTYQGDGGRAFAADRPSAGGTGS